MPRSLRRTDSNSRAHRDGRRGRRRESSVETLTTDGLDFRDPWGNRLQIIAYENVQFAKPDHVRERMGLSALEKSATGLAELAEKGMAPDE